MRALFGIPVLLLLGSPHASSLAVKGQPATYPLMKYSGPERIDLKRSPYEKTQQRTVRFGGPDYPYVLCRIDSNEVSRNKRKKAPEEDDVGYRLIRADNGGTVWQAWVKSHEMSWGRRHWLLLDVSASWIRNNATPADRVQNRCMDPLPRVWPERGDLEDAEPWSPNRPAEPPYRVLRRLTCKEGNREFLGDDYEQTSNLSCEDAARTLDSALLAKDHCTWEGDNQYPGRSTARVEVIPTSECPQQ